MALQKQVVSVPFTKGLDTKDDPKQVIPGKFLILENGIFTSPGRILKRNGFAALNQLIEGTTTPLSSGSGLANFKNELLLLTGNEAFSYSESTTRWSDKQTITNLQLSVSQIVRNTFEQTTPDVAIHASGLEVVTYEDSRGGSRYCLIDSFTGEQLLSDQLITSTAIKPKPFTLGNFLVILYVDTSVNHLRALPIPVLTPLSPFPFVDLGTNVNPSNPNYDATLYSTHLYYAYNNNSSGITLSAMDFFLDLNAPETVSGETASSCISISVDPATGQIWVAYHNGTQVKYFIFANSLPFTPFLAPTLIASNSNTILNISIIAFNTTASVFYTQTAVLPSNNFILQAQLTNVGVVSGNRVFVRSVSIIGKAFTFNTFTYITVAFDSILQPTYFTLRTIDAAVVAKFSPGVGGGTAVTNMVSEACSDGYGIYLMGSLQKDLLTTISGAIYTQTGVNTITLDFTDAHTSKVELGANLHLTGGLLNMYDGVSIVEHGFNIFPENITIASSPSGGGLAAGTYEYFVVYSWMDAQGQTHYSAHSVGQQNVIGLPISTFATFSSGASSITVASSAGMVVGQPLIDITTPANFQTGTVISSISGTTVGISLPTTAASAGAPGDDIQALTTTPITFTSAFGAGVSTITVSSVAGLVIGQVISDITTQSNILAGTQIKSISGSTITLTQPTVAASGSPDTLQTLDTGSATLTIPTLRLTQKKPPVRGPVSIQVYRTEDDQTIAYLVSSIKTPLLNDVTVDTVSFVDTSNDFSIVGNPTLYTTGGVIENIAAPAFSYITTYQDRIIGLPEESKNQWWYSKQNIPGAPVEFTDSFVNNVDQAGGDLVSCLKMDSELVFWKETLIYYITGVGPDSTGKQNDFSAPQNISSDVGCSDKDSLVLTPLGVFFKSLKGIYLLTRNLQLQYIGAGVEAYNQYQVISANLIENTQQVRFCLSNGQAIVYDYHINEWSTFTNISAVDSVIFQSQFTYLTQLGEVLQETPGKYTDDGEFIKLKLQTSWLSFTGLQGFQRVYQMLFLGDYFSPHNVAVYAAYDFNPFPTQQNVTPAGAILSSGVYGSDATYGESSPYGGPPQTYQFRVNLNRQKCQTIQITIEDQQIGAEFGENLALSAFGFAVGTKGTLNKIVAQGSNTPQA